MIRKFTFTLCSTILISHAIYGQDCDELRKENIQLKAKLDQFGINFNNNVKIKSFTKNLEINFINCEGNKDNQNVTLTFNIINKDLPNQSLKIMNNWLNFNQMINSNALDEIGNGFKPSNIVVGDSNSFDDPTNLPTDGNPVIVKLIFENVLPKTQKFNSITTILNIRNLVGGDNQKTGIVEFKDVVINWE